MTRATRPVPPAGRNVVSVAVLVIRSLTPCRGERTRAADDLADLLGDLGLTGRVRRSGERLDELFRVVGRGLHGPPARGRLRRRRGQQGREDPRLDVPGE